MIMHMLENIKTYMIDPVLGNDLYQGAMALSILGFFFYQLRSLPQRLYRIVKIYSTKTIAIREDSPIFEDVLSYITENICFTKSPRHSQIKVDFIDKKKLRRNADISRFLCKIAGTYCLASLEVDEDRGLGGGKNAGDGASQVTMLKKAWIIRLTVFGPEKAIEKILNKFECFLNEEKEQKPYIIVAYDNYSEPIKKIRRFSDSLCFDDHIYKNIKNKCLKFLAREEEYKKRGFSWAFGILLTGEPGTGKSSIIHTLASELDKTIEYVNIADMDDDRDLQRRMTRDYKNTIIVFEDIDCLFNQREGDDARITFSCFLNTLDGICSGSDGRIVIMTTNHIKKLDPALIRKGRVDFIVDIPNKPSIGAFKEYVERMYSSDITDDIIVDVYNTHNTTVDLVQHIREEFSI